MVKLPCVRGTTIYLHHSQVLNEIPKFRTVKIYIKWQITYLYLVCLYHKLVKWQVILLYCKTTISTTQSIVNPLRDTSGRNWTLQEVFNDRLQLREEQKKKKKKEIYKEEYKNIKIMSDKTVERCTEKMIIQNFIL